MSNKSTTHKFSKVEEERSSQTTEEWYLEMERFIQYLAGRNSGMAVEYDDIVQELALELVKGVQAYPDLPHNQLAAVLRQMFDNRIAELRYRYHVTHRKYAQYNISLSIEVSTRDFTKLQRVVKASSEDNAVPIEELIIGGPDPAQVYASKERVMEIRSLLSKKAKRVFDCLINGNHMFAMLVWLSSVRSANVFGNRSVKIRPWHISDALHMPEKEVRLALREIKHTYRGYNG